MLPKVAQNVHFALKSYCTVVITNYEMHVIVLRIAGIPLEILQDKIILSIGLIRICLVSVGINV